MRFERRTNIPLALLVAAPLGAVGAALLLSGFLVALAGANVLDAYRHILIGAFGSRLAISETLTRATPLIFTGLAAAVAFRARLWNIGAEGQFYVGALAAVALGSGGGLRLPAPILIPLLMGVGAGAGMLFLLAPLGLRLRFGVDEVVTTLLLNFVALLFVSMMIEGPLRDPLAFGWPQSAPVNAAAVLPKLIRGTRLHIGLLIALALSIIIWVIQGRSVFGPRGPGGGVQSASCGLRGRFACEHFDPHRLLVGRSSGPRRRYRGARGQDLRDDRPFTGFRLRRNCRRCAGSTQSDRRRRRGDVRRHDICGGRRNEPGALMSQAFWLM